MRVTGGFLRGRHLSPFKWKGTRPTQDRVRESLFNKLSHEIADNSVIDVLDLFAGTGIVSIEFSSRFNCKIVSVEQNFKAVEYMKRSKVDFALKNWSIIKSKVLTFINTNESSFDIIFADPPYEFKQSSEIIKYILSNNLLKTEGLLIWEHSIREDFSNFDEFTIKKDYGDSSLSFFYL